MSNRQDEIEAEFQSFQLANSYIHAHDWKSLKALIEGHPKILTIVNKRGEQDLEPTILFRMISVKDDSPEFAEAFQVVLHGSQSFLKAEERDIIFGNTAFTYACAIASPQVIRAMFTYYQREDPTILKMQNAIHNDARNTPLILAIKNGDIQAAIDLIPYYDEVDLVNRTRAGNTPLHLACYLRLEPVIQKLLERGRELGCREALLSQQRLNRHHPPVISAELYSAPQEFEKDPPWWDEVGKFKFAEDVHEGRKTRSPENPEMLRQLLPKVRTRIPLKTIKEYYPYGEGRHRNHFFTIKRTPRHLEAGDTLKLNILESFRAQLAGVRNLEQLNQFIGHAKQSQDYKLLMKSQGLFTFFFHWAGVKTDSEKAFEEMCQDARAYLNVYSPK